MTGDIDMAGNKISHLPAPTSDTEPATKKYSDDKFAEKVDVLTSHGFTMKDGINMGGFAITNLPEPILDTEPATKKWVTADFPTKIEILNGFTMNGILDLGGHSIEGVTVPANVDDAVTTKKYCADNFATLSGFTAQSFNLPNPTSDTEPVTKKYVDDNHLSEAGTLTKKVLL